MMSLGLNITKNLVSMSLGLNIQQISYNLGLDI